MALDPTPWCPGNDFIQHSSALLAQKDAEIENYSPWSKEEVEETATGLSVHLRGHLRGNTMVFLLQYIGVSKNSALKRFWRLALTVVRTG